MKEVTMCHLRAVQVLAWEDEDNHKNLSYDNVRHPPRYLPSTRHSCSQSQQISRAKKEEET
jgi:hypothetical protein